MKGILDYVIAGGIVIWITQVLLAVREAHNSKSRIARVHPLWYLWRRGPWWTRTVTLLTVLAVLAGLMLLSKCLEP
jgi:hypothetical protein